MTKTDSVNWILPLKNNQLMLAVWFDWEYLDAIEIGFLEKKKIGYFYLDVFKTNICLN